MVKVTSVERTGSSGQRHPLPEIEVDAIVFKENCLQLLDQVRAHQITLVVTSGGLPVARVVPPQGQAQSAFGFMRGTVLRHENIVEPDIESWKDSG
jgi:antitoxin (DNA-binding transcriptional repressor) of toxin-antitoxin stability system